MRYVSDLYNTLITDGETQQECILINGVNNSYPTALLSALDGDFTSDGVTIEETECESEDIRFGNVGSAQISFSLINERGWMLQDFPWGRMSCYIGVKYPIPFSISYAREEYVTVPNATAFVRNNLSSDDFYAIGNKIYRRFFVRATSPGQPSVTPGQAWVVYTDPSEDVVFTGLLDYDTFVIALGVGSCVVYDRETQSVTSLTPNRHLANKLMKGTSYSFFSRGTNKDCFRCTPQENLGDFLCENFLLAYIGKFEITKPDNLSDDIVELDCAESVITNLDIDATDFLSTITYPTTMKAIADAAIACANPDAVITDPSITEYTATIAASPFGNGSYTIRDILKYIAEAIGMNLIADTDNYFSTALKFKYVKACNPPGDYVESIGWSRIASGTLVIKSYTTMGIRSVLLKKQDGSTVSRTVGDLTARDVYEISNNPLVQSLPWDGVILSRFPSSPLNDPWRYYPASLTVICANPLVELGDTIRVESAEEQYTQKYDVYGREISGQFEYHPPIYIPLMHRKLHWQGFCFADYEATGNALRYAEKGSQTYQNNVAIDYADSLEDMLSTRIFNIEGNLGIRETAADATGVDVPSGTATNVNSIAIDTGHTYIVTAHLNFPSNSTGVRGLYVASTSGSTTAINGGGRIVQSAADGEATRMTCTFIMRTTSITTLYLTAYQTSGSTLNVTSYMDVLRII